MLIPDFRTEAEIRLDKSYCLEQLYWKDVEHGGFTTIYLSCVMVPRECIRVHAETFDISNPSCDRCWWQETIDGDKQWWIEHRPLCKFLSQKIWIT